VSALVPMADSVSAIVVSYADPEATRAAVASLMAGTPAPREVLVVDNHPTAPLRDYSAPGATVVTSGRNLGYTAACNLAATRARGDWLWFVNPDALADPDCLGHLLEAVTPQTAIVGAQILLPDGRTNAGDNPVHLTGISWAGRYELPREDGPAREVAAVSGASLMVRAGAFADLHGMCERFFLYQDDTDLCWRARLAGWTVRFCPRAVVHHDYEFDKGSRKWFWLERNRLWSVLANYSWLSLGLLAPLLLVAELAIVALAVREAWAGQLVRAWASDLRSPRDLATWRRQVQEQRRAPDSALMSLMATRFQTALMPSVAAQRAGRLLDLYGAVVRAVLARCGK
jgi:GT2 family glycosyltransferase